MCLIDADALKTQIFEKCKGKGYMWTFVMGLIDKDSVIQTAKPQWILCSERLPEKDGYYIVTMRGDIWGEPDVWESTTCGFYGGKWDEDGTTISAWQPFPKLYRLEVRGK